MAIPTVNYNGGVPLMNFDTNNLSTWGLPGTLSGSIRQGMEGNMGGMFGGMWDWLGSEKTGNALGGFSTLMNMYTGFKALGLARDRFRFEKKAFNKNFEAQQTAYNNEQRDAWRANQLSASDRGRSFQGMDQWSKERFI